ncbi:MAG TPA: TIGR00730 family Rossman fold protein, partial [Tianweitania sediminis]|nr:TIGR00730 family Rossman fold protein [Tianweitania sediminis]
MTSITSVCVYCGSSPGRAPHYLEAGQALGAQIARAGLRLIYGGGTRGVMGAVSRGAIEAGGKVTGIIPRFLLSKEAADGQHAGL